jgi:hypothetical protein
MSTEDIISQSIYHGSPFEAMDSNFFTPQELIDYLAKHSTEIPKEKLYLTFTALMTSYPSMYHYSNGKHLLTYLPQDIFIQRIFIIMGGSPELPLSKDDTTQTLWSLVFDIYSDFMNDIWSEEHERCMLLCNRITPKLSKKELLFKDKEFIHLLYEYRCDKIITLVLPVCGIPLKDTIDYSIDSEWFDKYPKIKNHYSKYIHRVSHLKSVAPFYFEKMTESFLYQLCGVTLQDFEKIDFELLKITCQCFPQQFSNLDVSSCFQRISIYPISVRTYILGLSCFPKIPSKKELDDALQTLSDMGIDEYSKMILSKQPPKPPEDKIANQQDTLFEEPENYLSLDRLDVEENGKIYRFTRPEFKKLFSDKKNFWTKQPLSYSDLYSLQMRINMCKELNLPSSDTFLVLLEKACKGCLYEELKTSTPPTQEEDTSSTINQSLLYLYQLFLTNPSSFTSSFQTEPSDEIE